MLSPTLSQSMQLSDIEKNQNNSLILLNVAIFVNIPPKISLENVQVAYPMKVTATIFLRKYAFSQSFLQSGGIRTMARKGENIFKRKDGRW